MVVGGYSMQDDGVYGITVKQYESGWSFFLDGDDAEIFRHQWELWKLKISDSFEEFLYDHEYNTLLQQLGNCSEKGPLQNGPFFMRAARSGPGRPNNCSGCQEFAAGNRGVRGLSGIAAVVKFQYPLRFRYRLSIGICEKCRKMAVFAYISALARISREKWRFSAVFYPNNC